MSYDIYYGQHDLNITSNITPMMKLCGLYLMDLQSMTGHEAMVPLGQCLRKLTNYTYEHQLKELEPKNGWGTLEQTIKFLTRLYFIMQDHPCERISIHC